MRIDLNSRLAESYGANGRSKAETAASRASSGSATDEAHFSSEHQTVQKLEAEAGKLPDVRRDKVEALRSAVESGRYRPSAEQIAGAMLEEIVR